MHWLICYRRATGTLERCDRYSGPDSGRAALTDRFLAEWQSRDDPDLEIVVLGAQSLEALRATHGRYFLTVAELASH